MERHKCKLCSRTFSNGRALGGHMKAHLTSLPLPPPRPHPLITSSTPSFSYSSSDDDREQQVEVVPSYRESDEKALSYGLRENPRKNFRFSDPEFSFAVDAGSVVVVQDRESETESKNNPTRRRSKRSRKSCVGGAIQKFQVTKAKSNLTESPPPTEPEPVSSVSDTSPDEDVAMCLMMLSRDRWMRNVVVEQDQVERSEEPEEIKLKRKHQSDNTKTTCRSSRALDKHNRTNFPEEAETNKIAGNDKIFECPFCYKVFGSGQALGGHKRSHLLPASSSIAFHSVKCSIDLNLPAPAEEDDELSVVSDA
ncbi:hypothetical protein K1719_041485 [Acacia pycnantha]|nr:hypothetical protein K1719_041485 [Acacia pycnantha]